MEGYYYFWSCRGSECARSYALFEEDRIRNATITSASRYNGKSAHQAQYGLYCLVKDVAGKMPLFTMPVAQKLAQTQLDVSHKATHGSIYGEISSQGDMDLEKRIRYARGRKKDALYNRLLRRRFLGMFVTT